MESDSELLSNAHTPEELEVLVRRLFGVTEAAYERRAQLEEALRSRVVIEQAKGILAERHRLDVEQAFELLRRAARSSRTKIHVLAGDVVASRESPEAVLQALER